MNPVLYGGSESNLATAMRGITVSGYEALLFTGFCLVFIGGYFLYKHFKKRGVVVDQ